MNLTQIRDLATRAQRESEKAAEAADAAMEANEVGIARLHAAHAHAATVQAQNIAEHAHNAAIKAISEGARGGTLCSSKEEWDIAVYTARAAEEAKLHRAVAQEAVKSLTVADYFTN